MTLNLKAQLLNVITLAHQLREVSAEVLDRLDADDDSLERELASIFPEYGPDRFDVDLIVDCLTALQWNLGSLDAIENEMPGAIVHA